MSYEYLCNKGVGCKHFAIEFDVYTAFEGDTNISDERWVCLKRDDEICVPDCTEYERKAAS